MEKIKHHRKPNFPFLIRLTLALVFLGLCFAAFRYAFYKIHVFEAEFVPLVARILADFSIYAIILLGTLMVLTLLFGRFYCSLLCPVGILQEILMLITRRRVSHRTNRPYKYVIALVAFGTLFGGTTYLLRLIDPYTIFGSAASMTTFGLIALLIICLLALWKGRLICTDICPVGTVLGLFSKHALFQIYIDTSGEKCVLCGSCAKVCPTGSIDFKNQTINNETCVKCLRCLGRCRFNALRFGLKKSKPMTFNPNRRQFLNLCGAALFLGIMYKSGVKLSQTIANKVKTLILPPGAGNPQTFANKCLNCNLCVENCPMKVIQKANTEYPAVHLDYSKSFCSFNCNTCSSVCPSGALKRLSLEEKRRTRLAIANVNPKICIQCGLCARECPRGAIIPPEEHAAKVDTSKCIGCGACQNVCPVQAIKVRAIDNQSTLTS